MVLVLTEITKTLIMLYFMAGRTISNGADLQSGTCRSTVYHYPTRPSNNKYTDVQTDPTYYRNK
jgi:hypothetical protein